MNIEKRWEHFSHEADIGIRGICSTVKSSFEMGAVALTNVVTDHPKTKLSIVCHVH